MPITEVVTLPKKPLPPPATQKALRWSPRKFAEAWERAKAERKDFSVAHLMIATGVRSEATLRNWRRGTSEPDASQAMALAAVLGLPPLGLFE